MDYNETLPFERNRYYAGKLLTSADFQAEQYYMNHKRRFFHRLFCGEGVLCGLGVYNLDDTSVMVESGAAIDGMGREIVVESSVIKKLSVLEGFDDLCSKQAVLCLRYHEEPVDPVYAIRGQEPDERYECNRIREGYQLFLQDAELMQPFTQPQSEFLTTALLYADADFTVELTLPTTVSCGRKVRLTLAVTRRSDTGEPFSMSALLRSPALLGPEGGHEIPVLVDGIHIPQNTPFRSDFWATVQDQPAAEVVLIVEKESTRIRVGESDHSIPEKIMVKFSLQNVTPEELILRSIGAISLETQDLSGARDFVPLAVLSLQQAKNSYLIDGVDEAGVKRYVRLPAAAGRWDEYAGWFADSAGPGPAIFACGAEKAGEAETPGPPDPVYATGVCEIPLGINAHRGQHFQSDEIIHGLGKGNVFVQVGFEYLSEDERLGANARNIIYGDPRLFAAEEPAVTCASVAVKVMADRGSFMVAAQMERNTAQPILLLRWVALRLPAGEEETKLQRLSGKSISAIPPTVVLAARESHYFSVQFKNMEPCTLTYELTEKDSGEITLDGVYTAPAREGVYEIRISCAEMPLVSTYAYAVVKQRDAQDSTVRK